MDFRFLGIQSNSPVRELNVSPGDSILESQNHNHSTGFEMPRLEDLWGMEQYFKAARAPL
ncbi:hypothetical protein P3S68_032601 [Capsicum galapagoense]